MSSPSITSNVSRRTPTNSASPASAINSRNRSPSRPATPSAMPSGTVAKPRPARAATASSGAVRVGQKRTGSAPNTMSAEEEDSRAESATLIEDLKVQLNKAQTASEEYAKQLYVLQSRLDDALNEQTTLEESTHLKEQRIEDLQVEKEESLRQRKDLEARYEAHHVSATKEHEEAAAREEELSGIIQRLKESLSTRESRVSIGGDTGEGRLSRTASFRGRASPNTERPSLGSPALVARDSSQGSSRLILQKDKVIEELRLELAEAQIRLVEVENAGGGRLQELEKTLLETRMSNAKLMEDNESYQYLLQERTLSGDLANKGVFLTTGTTGAAISPTPSQDFQSTSLADELESAKEQDSEQENTRKLEVEVSALREQNKALTLYINRIITRLLQSDNFEALFEEGATKVPLSVISTNIAPKEVNIETEPALTSAPAPQPLAGQENAPASLLQRAGSIFGRRQRPQSYVPPTSAISGDKAPAKDIPPEEKRLPPAPNPHEDPHEAPSIPLKRADTFTGGTRSHRRVKSELSAQIVNNMYRNPASGGGPPMSPSGLGSPRERTSSFFSARMSPPPPLIIASGASSPDPQESETLSVPKRDASELAADPARAAALARLDAGSDSGYGEEPSSPHSLATSSVDGRPMGSGTVFASSGPGGNKIRPLRLVREMQEAEEAAAQEKKKANRNSFMGWFARGPAMSPADALSPGSNPST